MHPAARHERNALPALLQLAVLMPCPAPLLANGGFKWVGVCTRFDIAAALHNTANHR
jgi:hypothetical protein